MTTHPKNLVIEMTITPQAPLSIAMPVATGQRENDWGNFPVMPVANEEGDMEMTGYLPASTVRGALRRAAALAQFEGRDDVTAAEAYETIIGQSAASEKEEEKIDLQAIADEREAKPIVDLFGSGLGIKSRLDFLGHFMPPKAVLPYPLSMPRKDLDATEGALEALSAKERKDTILRVELNGRRADAESTIEKLERKLRSNKKPLDADQKKDVEAQLKAAKALFKSIEADIKDQLGPDAMKVSTRAIFTHWALPAGLPLKSTLLVRNVRNRDFDLIMDGLNALSRKPILGAQSARGGGGNVKFVADFRLDGQLLRTVTSGKIDENALVSEFSE